MRIASMDRQLVKEQTDGRLMLPMITHIILLRQLRQERVYLIICARDWM